MEERQSADDQPEYGELFLQKEPLVNKDQLTICPHSLIWHCEGFLNLNGLLTTVMAPSSPESTRTFQFSTGFALIKGLFEGVRRDVREDFFQGKLLPVLLPFVNRYNVATFPLGPMLYEYTPVGITAGAP